MPLTLLLHTLTTNTSVTGDIVVYWQNRPTWPTHQKPKILIDATPLTLDQVLTTIQSSQGNTVTLIGLDVLLPLKNVPISTLIGFIRTISTARPTTLILNSDDALRSGDHETLLITMAHGADKVIALRALPSGRDKEYAGMVRVTRGYRCDRSVVEGERLYKYGECMMDAII